MKETEVLLTPIGWLANRHPVVFALSKDFKNDFKITSEHMADYAKYYHDHIIKSSLPSEQEIKQIFRRNVDSYTDRRIDNIGKVTEEPDLSFSIREETFVKIVLELLTKGGKQ